MYPSLAGCGTSWRSFSAKGSGKRTKGPSQRASRTCMITQRTFGYVSAPFGLSACLTASSNQSAFPGGVLAVLWRNTLHTKEAPDQHAGGREQRFTQTQVPPSTQDQRILGNCSKPQRNWWAAGLFACICKSNDFTVNILMRPVQPQLCTTPTWTSETTRHQLCATFWTEKNITPTYMWGSDNVFVFTLAAFNFPLEAFVVVDVRALTSPLGLRRIPLEAIPEDEAECATWLHKLYQEKVGGVFKSTSDRFHGHIAARQEQDVERAVLSCV